MQLTAQPVLVDILYPKALAKTTTGKIAREIILVVGFVSLVAICAQIIIRLPFTTVPITGQTFGVLLAGGALGAWRGAGALALYLFAGMFLPIYAPSSASSVIGDGTIHFLFPWNGNSGLLWDMSSGGYIVGFVLAAWAAGIFARKGWYHTPWSIGGLIISNALIYIPGLLWLAYLISSGWIHPGAGMPLSELISGGDTLEKTLIGGLYPFILGDLMKLYLAALALPAAWMAVTRFKRNSH
jgi:biotin transport system substrate-specific component